MVKFNELRICDDNQYMVIECEINSDPVYANMYIKEIYLEYYENASTASMPSDKAYRIYNNSLNDTSVRSKRIVFTQADLGMTDFGTGTFDEGLFYVIVKCDGDLPASIANYPCGADATTKIGVVLDWRAFYRLGMSYIGGLIDKCGNPCASTSEFEHFILMWNSLKLAIAICDWDLVSDLWRKFMGLPSGTTSVASYSCGCRG